MSLAETSAENYAKLALPNPGRLVAVGLSEDGKAYRLFTLMGGRSPGSKNRYYHQQPDLNGQSDLVRTAINNQRNAKGDAAATLYVAHAEWFGRHVASNGDQTDKLAFALAHKVPFEEAQSSYLNEGPDNGYTARISVAVNIDHALRQAIMGRIISRESKPADSEYLVHRLAPGPGEGFYTTTYDGKGDMGPNREEKPRRILLPGTLTDNMDAIWESFDPTTRGNLAGKEIEIGSNRVKYAYRTIHPKRTVRDPQ